MQKCIVLSDNRTNDKGSKCSAQIQASPAGKPKVGIEKISKSKQIAVRAIFLQTAFHYDIEYCFHCTELRDAVKICQWLQLWSLQWLWMLATRRLSAATNRTSSSTSF